MRVLMTADTVGGVWTYALELARALEPEGVIIALATMGAPLAPEQRCEVEHTPNVMLFESDYRLEWMDHPWDDVARAGRWLLDIEVNFAPDVVHLNGYAHGALPWRAPTLVVGHSCVLSWWRAVKKEEAPATWDRYRAAVADGLRAADCVVAPTQAMLDSLRAHYGPLPHARAFPNGRDVRRFSPAAQKEPFVLSSGRLWDEAKNLGTLARAAERLPWPVYVAGEERHPDSGGIATAKSVRPLGRLRPEVLAGWMARAAVYALPARYEPFGLSALEAALSGCALVLGDIDSLREVWGDAALFVPPDDATALEAALLRLINDAGLRATMAARARERAVRYTAERMAADYLSIYRYLLQAKNHANRPLLSLASI